LKDDLEEMDAKWRFLQSIVDGSLKIVNQEDAVVLTGLRSLGLPPRSKPDAADSLEAYEYLLRMRVDRIKKSSVEEAKKDCESLKRRIAELERMTASGIWSKELESFLEAWTAAEKNMLEIMTASTEVGSGSGKAKKVVLKKKGSAAK
jgi:hypothetical protein